MSLITAANNALEVFKICWTHFFGNVSLCYTANSSKSRFHTVKMWSYNQNSVFLWWASVSLLQNTQFMLSIPKDESKSTSMVAFKRGFVQLRSCVCVCLYFVNVCEFCLYLQYFSLSLKLALNMTKLDHYCSIKQCNAHRELTIQDVNLQNTSLDESSSITRLVTACRGDECVTASSSREWTSSAWSQPCMTR